MKGLSRLMKQKWVYLVASTLILAILLQTGNASATTMVRGSQGPWSVANLKSQYEYRYGVLKDGAISTSDMHALGLKKDGTVVAAGDNSYGQCNVSRWKDIVAVCAGPTFSLGLRADGTVIAAGNNMFGQCNVSDWTNIIAICASSKNSAGLRADGTVVVAGDDLFGQCRVQEWKNIVAISMTDIQTLGLTEEGKVIVTPVDLQGWEKYQADPYMEGYYTEISTDSFGDAPWEQGVGTWKHIISIVCESEHALGLCEDGSVRATGETCNDQVMVDEWKDVASIAAGTASSVGWLRDGSFTGTNMCPYGEQWINVIAVACAEEHFIGLRQDGTVIFSAEDPYFDSLLEPKASEISSWRDIGRSSCEFTFEFQQPTAIMDDLENDDYSEYEEYSENDVVSSYDGSYESNAYKHQYVYNRDGRLIIRDEELTVENLAFTIREILDSTKLQEEYIEYVSLWDDGKLLIFIMFEEEPAEGITIEDLRAMSIQRKAKAILSYPELDMYWNRIEFHFWPINDEDWYEITMTEDTIQQIYGAQSD